MQLTFQLCKLFGHCIDTSVVRKPFKRENLVPSLSTKRTTRLLPNRPCHNLQRGVLPSFCFENDLLLRFLTQKGLHPLPKRSRGSSHLPQQHLVASVGEDNHIVSTQAPTSLGMLFAKRLWKTCRKTCPSR